MATTLHNKNDRRILELNYLLNNISDAILFESFNNEILFVNQNFCNLFKIPLSSETLIGTNCAEAAKQFAHLFKYPTQFIDGIFHTYEQKKSVLNEELLFADGSPIYRDYKPMLNHPDFSGHLWIYKNAVKLKSKLGKVEVQQIFYKNLLNNLPADIAIFDIEHRYIFLNIMAISTIDTSHWLIGKDDFDYCRKTNKPLELAINRRAFFTEAISKKEIVEFEEINYTNDGKKVYNLRKYYPIQKPDGSIETVIGYGINITKLKEREEIVVERERALRDLLEFMNQLMVVINEAGNIQYSNSQWSLLIGISPEDCLDKKLISYIKTNKTPFTENINTYIKKCKYKYANSRVCINDKNGKKHTFIYYLSNFIVPGSLDNNLAVFFSDITLQLMAENELKKIARQERKLNELKSNFVGLVSHELRTPLSVIMSNAELIEMKSAILKDGQPPSTLVNTNRIIEQVTKMTQLMNDFLFLGKIEMDKIPLNPELFDVVNLVNELKVGLYAPWKDERILEVSVKGIPQYIIADQSMIRNSLINIINNAFKYSPGKKAPKLRLRFTDKIWQVIIVDYGIGISNEDQKYIYEPFVRGHNVDEIEGTGLGLVVVKFFIKKNKGKIYLKSYEGKGTAVILQFLR